MAAFQRTVHVPEGARMTTVAKHMVSVACAATTVQKPRGRPSATNISSSDRPRITRA